MSKKIEVKDGKVWARYNGVSIAVSPSTEKYVKTYDHYSEPFSNDWHASKHGDSVLIECNVTGEILCREDGSDLQRIPIKPSYRVVRTLQYYERSINHLCTISEELYGSCDCDNPLWVSIEYLLHEQTAFAIRNHVTPEQFHRLSVKEVRHD